jgi:hypothetical protein
VYQGSKGTRRACEKVSQSVAPNTFLSNKYVTSALGKRSQQICSTYFRYFQTIALSEQLPNGRKFAQSGHPGTLKSSFKDV